LQRWKTTIKEATVNSACAANAADTAHRLVPLIGCLSAGIVDGELNRATQALHRKFDVAA